MTSQQLQSRVSQLFRDCVRAHGEAFPGCKEDDPEWPAWYADFLQKPLEQALDTEFSRSHLIYCLMTADFEHTARAMDADLAAYFAAQFVEHYAPSETASADKLALYTSPGCPFCWRVTEVISRLGLEVEMRNVISDRATREELIRARGRMTVPVLRIQSPDGEVRWMPESLDIIHYLEHMYG
jgi:glutaredoxin